MRDALVVTITVVCRTPSNRVGIRRGKPTTKAGWFNWRYENWVNVENPALPTHVIKPFATTPPLADFY